MKINRKTSRPSRAAENGIHVVFEIHIAEGVEAQHLALEQARVLQEVTAWLVARNPSDYGQNHAA